MTAILIGARLLFAAMFLVTGTTKVVHRIRFELVLVQLFGTRPFRRVSSRPAALAVACYELALAVSVGGALLVPVSSVLVLVTMVVFAAVVTRAWRLHVGCGCFPDRRPSEVSSLIRSAVLIAFAVLLVLGGAPPIGGFPRLLLGVACAVALGLTCYLAYQAANLLVRRRYPTPPQPRMVPVLVVADIMAERGRPVPASRFPADADGWAEITDVCRVSGLPVSTMLAEFERRPRANGPRLQPVGTRIAVEGLAAPTVVVLVSATCTRCPKHLPGIVGYLRAQGYPPQRVLVAVSGDGAGADRFVTALADLATVVVEAATGPLTTAFGVREFPAFYVVDDEWRITAAANTIDDLTTVPA